MKDFIERLRAKPEHDRKRITFFASAGVTALIAVLWLSTTVASGTLALKPSSSVTPNINTANTGVPSNALLGAAAAFQNTSSAEVHVEDVGSAPQASSAPDTRTVIPF